MTSGAELWSDSHNDENHLAFSAAIKERHYYLNDFYAINSQSDRSSMGILLGTETTYANIRDYVQLNTVEIRSAPISVEYLGEQLVYATVYTAQIDEDAGGTRDDDNFRFGFDICLGQTSNDKGYKPYVITQRNLIYFEYSAYDEKSVQRLESRIVGHLAEDELDFDVKSEYDIAWNIDATRLSIRALILTLVLYVRDKPTPIKMFDALLDCLSEEQLTILGGLADLHFPASRFMLCQKTVPLSIMELACVNDYRYKVWKELYVLRGVSDIRLNMVAPSFPFHFVWHEVVDIVPPEPPSDEMQDIAAIRESLASLRDLGDAEPTAEERLLGVIDCNYRHRQLSGYSCLIFNEDTGTTLRKITQTGEYVNVSTKLLDYAIFNYIWALTAMHTSLGVAHGDVHENNLTLRVLSLEKYRKYEYTNGGAPTPESQPDYESHYRYKGDVGTLHYVQRYTDGMWGVNPAIIDFGECIFSAKAADKMLKGDVGNTLREQVRRAERYLKRAGPEYLEAYRKIHNANSDEAFAIICVADFVGLARSIKNTLGAKSEYAKTASSHILDICSGYIRGISGGVNAKCIGKMLLESMFAPSATAHENKMLTYVVEYNLDAPPILSWMKAEFNTFIKNEHIRTDKHYTEDHSEPPRYTSITEDAKEYLRLGCPVGDPEGPDEEPPEYDA